MIYHLIKAGFVLISFCWSFQLTAQEHLTGEWISYSINIENKEIAIKGKREKTVIILNKDQSYVKHFYMIKGITDSEKVKLSYHLVDGKLEIKDANGRILKQKKTKEQGTYQINRDVIQFVTFNNKYTVPYQLQEEILTLKQLVKDAIKEDYAIKFKRK